MHRGFPLNEKVIEIFKHFMKTDGFRYSFFTQMKAHHGFNALKKYHQTAQGSVFWMDLKKQ